MKTMTCKQLGGPCDLAFRGSNADEIIKSQDQHLKDIVARGDVTHEAALKDMQARWKNPLKGMSWYLNIKKLFSTLPENM